MRGLLLRGFHEVKFHDDINIRYWSEMSNDDAKPAAKMETTAVEREAIEEHMQGTVMVQNQSSVDDVLVEEVSMMSESDMQELPNRQEDDNKLHGKLDDMERNKLCKMDDIWIAISLTS